MLNESAKNKLIVFYFLISVLIFSFIALSNGSGYFASVDLKIFHLAGKPVIIHFIFTLFFLAILIIFTAKNIKFYKLHLLLFFFAIVPLITHGLKGEFTSFMTHYVAVIITVVSFFIGSQYSGKIENITKIVMIFGFILSMQVIAAAVVSEVPYADINYKYYMRIPIAASNVIAAFLNPCYFFIAKNYRGNRILKWALLLLLAFAVVLTKSRGGVFILLFTFVWLLYKRKTRYKTVRRVFVIFLFAALSAIALNMAVIDQFILGYMNVYDGNSSFFNSLSSGRLNLYVEELSKWLNHFFIGNGMVYEESFTGSHNLILSLLTQFGLIGFLIYSFALGRVLIKISSQKEKDGLAGATLFLYVSLAHGMIELNFFNYTGDMMFWFVAGVSIGLIMHRNSNEAAA